MNGHQSVLMRTLICFALVFGSCFCSDCPLEQEELGSLCTSNDFAYCTSVTSYTRTACINSECVFWTPENCTCTSDAECQNVLPDDSMCYNGQCLEKDLLNGESCITNSQCLSQICSPTTLTCQGVGYGEVCLLVGCEEGLTCYLNGTYPPVCNYPKTNGQNCTTVFDDNECQSDLICAFRNVSGTFQKMCQPYKTLGEECVLPQDCVSGLTCVTVNKTFTCQYPVPLGAYCNTNHDCESTAVCNFGTCILKNGLQDGNTCNQDIACESNLCLYTYENGDNKAYCASNATGSIETGGYCNPLIPQLCQTGFCSCTGWSETGACINAICECPLKEGDSCVGPGSRCANGLICGYEGKCVKLFSKGNGANCINNFECELCRYCSDDGECSSHTSNSCFDSVEFYQAPQSSVDFMQTQIEKADSNDFCVNGKTCQCDGTSKKCESAGEDWEMAAQNWFMCSQFGSHFGTDAMAYTCGFIPSVYDHNPPASQLTPDCQRLVADYFCCTWYTTLFVEKYTDNQVVLNNRASLNGYLDYNVDCMNRTLTDVVFEPCCGSNNITNDCPYWANPVFTNYDYTFSLVNTTECKSYAITHFSECSDDTLPWAWIIAGIISASVLLALVLGLTVWFVRRRRGKNTYTYTSINTGVN